MSQLSLHNNRFAMIAGEPVRDFAIIVDVEKGQIRILAFFDAAFPASEP